MKLVIRQRNTYKTLELEADSITVADIKKTIDVEMEVPVDQQRLVFKGKILSSDAQVITEAELEDGKNPVHLVRIGVTSPEVPAAPPAPSIPADVVPNMGAMMNMMTNLISGDGGDLSALAGIFSDPDMKDTILEAGKVAQEHLSQNPGLITTMFKSEEFQDAMKNIVGKGKVDDDFEDFMTEFAENIEENQTLGDFLNDANFINELPQLFDKSMSLFHKLKSSDADPSTDAEITKAMGEIMQNTTIDGIIKNLVGDMKHDMGKDIDKMTSKIGAGAKNYDPRSLEMLLDFGFTDEEKNIAALTEANGDIDKALRLLLGSEPFRDSAQS